MMMFFPAVNRDRATRTANTGCGLSTVLYFYINRMDDRAFHSFSLLRQDSSTCLTSFLQQICGKEKQGNLAERGATRASQIGGAEVEQIRDRLYIATFSAGAVSAIRENRLGIELNDLCISENLNAEKVAQTIEAMQQEIRAAETNRVLVHGPFTEIIPASIDPRAVQLGLDRLAEAYAVCTRLGVKKLIVHSGYIPLLYFREWHIEKSACFWRRFGG